MVTSFEDALVKNPKTKQVWLSLIFLTYHLSKEPVAQERS